MRLHLVDIQSAMQVIDSKAQKKAPKRAPTSAEQEQRGSFPNPAGGVQIKLFM
jgi:hypothetical protein